MRSQIVRKQLFGVLVALGVVAAAGAAEAKETYYVAPPVYDQKQVTIVSREIRLGWDGTIWLKLVVGNHTGKEMIIDFNQIYAQRVDNSTVAREKSVIPSRNKPVSIPGGLSADLSLDYKVGKTPAPLELVLNKAFIVGGKPLALPNYEIDPVGDPKLIALKKDKIELKQKVHFATDKATIMPDSFAMLDEVALALRVRPTMRVRIEGHTDERGADKHNQQLSQARADSVRTFLATKKVQQDRLEPVGFGVTKPIAQGDTETAHEQNRRVEFVITAQ
jgi:outer membrane protein OmpA-like peptidoglycan-associated protein